MSDSLVGARVSVKHTPMVSDYLHGAMGTVEYDGPDNASFPKRILRVRLDAPAHHTPGWSPLLVLNAAPEYFEVIR